MLLIKTFVIVAIQLFLVLISFAFLVLCYGIFCAARKVMQKPIVKFLEHERSRSSYATYCEFPVALVKVIVTNEDFFFWEHCGISFKQLVYSIILSFRAHKVVGAGSGITQQLAKNVYFSGVRSYRRKLAEAFAALYIEKKLSKEEILELYLNIIYFGQNQFGIGNAAQYYYGKKASELDMEECISLAAILPSPYRYNPFSRTGLFPQVKANTIKRLIPKGIISFEDGETYAAKNYTGSWNNHGYHTKEGLVAHVKSCFCLNTAYVWGGLGARLDDDLIDAKAKQFPDHFSKNRVMQLKKLAKRVVYGFDCSGLLKCYLMGGIDNFKYNTAYDINSERMLELSKRKGKMETMPEEEGICVFMSGHVGVYVGNGEVIEATNNKKFGDGVVRTRLSDREWTNWFELV